MKTILGLLSDYDQNEVDIFYAYIQKLGSDEKNYWFKSIKPNQFANAFKKVSGNGLRLDGESVTLAFRKPYLVINYDYHAYKNKVLLSHPESVFDFGLVYNDDEFAHWKDSGKVRYTHKSGNPFSKEREIIGAYGIIKNNTGEFIETLDMNDIKKMRKSSKMDFIWKTWFDRMVLKSMIRRVCAAHFKELVRKLDDEDNQNSDPDRAALQEEVLQLIDDATTHDQLGKIYSDWIEKVENRSQFISIIGERKKEITELKAS